MDSESLLLIYMVKSELFIMKILHYPLCLLCLISLLGLPSFDVLAKKSDQEQARKAVLRGDILPLKQILDKVDLEFKGNVIEIELEQEDDEWIYEIKLLNSNGRILEIEIDAKTAKILDVDHK